MSKPSTDVFATPKQADSLTRADALEREITDLHAQINAASHRLLQLIAELDDEAPWGAWGLTSCAHWLNWRCGIGLNSAREKIRVADSANEAQLLELAHHATAVLVEKLVRAYRCVLGSVESRAEREQAVASQAARELNYYHDDDGCLVIRARLPAEEGALNLDLAISGLIQSGERSTRAGPFVSQE
jgi:hypothetical protein